MRTDIMIDLETLSNRPDAVILQIAAVEFSAEQPLIGASCSFNRYVTPASCKDLGLHTSDDTVDWWKKQSEQIKQKMREGQKTAIPCRQALTELAQWIAHKGECYVWSHGATFDLPILASAYMRCNMRTPWKYVNARDTRTLFALVGKDLKDLAPRDMNEMHDALFDATAQAIAVSKAWAMVKAP